MTPIVLRDYQQDMIVGCRAALKRVKRVLLQAPTGAGKTVLASYMISRCASRGDAAWFICHRAELVAGTSNTFTKFGIPHSQIAAGYSESLEQLVQVCSIDTLKNRLKKLKAPRLAVIDEAHHSGAAGWSKVIDWLRENGTTIVGLSATPQRLDGKGLDAQFDEIVLGPQTAWLIEKGNLAPYKLYAPHVPDMKGVRKAMGDFSKADAAARMDKPTLTGDAIEHWKKYANGMRTVVFAINVDHSKHIAEQFCAAGIPAAHLDGDTPKAERKAIIAAYAAGELQVLTNVDLFGEGFDLSAIAQTDVTIDCVMLMRPTQSLALFLQQVGRALRPALGKIAVILDHAGNVMRHGFPDDEREWFLVGKKGKSKGGADTLDAGPPPPMTCGCCFQQVRRPAVICPTCGTELTAPAEVKAITVSKAELIEIKEREKARIRDMRKREEAACKSLQDWIALGKQRGYEFPAAWALKRHGLRSAKAA
jgi:superfamily II DNA or RNA helicase